MPLLLPRLPLVIVILLFPLLGLALLGRRRSGPANRWTIPLFAALNIALTFCLFTVATWRDSPPKSELAFVLGPAAWFLTYVGIAMVEYAFLRLAARQQGRWWTASLIFPPFALILIRFIFAWWDPFRPLLAPFTSAGTAGMFLGISYLAFRVVRLAFEVRNAVVPVPTIPEYLSFVFFCPTMSIGPITTYSVFHRTLYTPDYSVTAPGNAALRICKGLVKYLLLGSLLSQLSYAGLLLDGHSHGYVDLGISVFAYYLYLYCNFSGYCDIVIGAAALVGIQVHENFDKPFGSRNLQEFWNRWHMSLSFFMRDIVFAPLSKFLVRRLGPRNVNHAIALTISVVFLLVGVWHGAGWNFAAYGVAHAAGVVTTHYYTIALKKRLGRDRLKAYNANRWVRAAAVSVTFCYCAATLFLFANSFADMRRIFSILSIHAP